MHEPEQHVRCCWLGYFNVSPCSPVRFARKAFNLGLLLCLGETGLVSTVTSRLAEKYTFSASSFAVTDLLAEIFVLQKFNIDTPLQEFMLM